MAKLQREPDPLEQRAQQVQRIKEFVDSTSFEGDQREAFDELTTVDQHPADSSDQLFQREIDDTVRRIVDAEAQEIEEARQRQQEGTYGTCERCQRQIDPARLEARPEARYCIECQRELEQAKAGVPTGEVYEAETTTAEPRRSAEAGC